MTGEPRSTGAARPHTSDRCAQLFLPPSARSFMHLVNLNYYGIFILSALAITHRKI